jgi:hypothetical protein
MLDECKRQRIVDNFVHFQTTTFKTEFATVGYGKGSAISRSGIIRIPRDQYNDFADLAFHVAGSVPGTNRQGRRNTAILVLLYCNQRSLKISLVAGNE